MRTAGKSEFYFVLVFLVLLIYVNTSNSTEQITREDEVSPAAQEGKIQNDFQKHSEIQVVEDTNPEPTQEEIISPKIYDIPLSDDLQQYIWNLGEKYDLSYELILAVIKTESDFDTQAISYDNSSYGLMQLNHINTIDWLAKEVGIDDFDPFNPYHNLEAGIWYLAWLRDYWQRQDLSEEDRFALVLLSYNRGIEGAKRYVKETGKMTHKYVEKIQEYKTRLERDDISRRGPT